MVWKLETVMCESGLFLLLVGPGVELRLLACQKRAPDLILDGHEPPCGYWELNSGPLEE